MTDIKDVKTSAIDFSEKVKAIYLHIVVSGNIERPYYSIHWYDIEKKTMICGYSSYDLNLVKKWLQEDFEVVEEDIDNLINRQQAEIENLEYKLLGVMHFVDKWLNGAELEQDEVNRASAMREKTLQIVEKLEEENDFLKSIDTDKIKAEAIKEYMKRLEEMLSQNIDISNAGYQSIIYDMDKAYEEMVGEE